jgi:hypothetical protein
MLSEDLLALLRRWCMTTTTHMPSANSRSNTRSCASRTGERGMTRLHDIAFSISGN